LISTLWGFAQKMGGAQAFSLSPASPLAQKRKPGSLRVSLENQGVTTERTGLAIVLEGSIAAQSNVRAA
jgi:hypothetical protein